MKLTLFVLVFLQCVISHDIFYDIKSQNKYTAIIPKGGVQCFYQPISKDTQTINIQYEVTKANFDLDIDCIVKNEQGVQLFTARRRKGRKFDISCENYLKNDIEICFSNHYSRMDEKHVYFSVTLDNKRGFTNINAEKTVETKEDNEDRILELKEIFQRTKYLREIVENIESGITESKGLLAYLLAALKQDDHVLVAVIRRIDFWMKIVVSFSLVCFMRQVYLIKSVFQERIMRDSRRQSRA